ncbi:hypothetical protein G9A89_005377 [Geosiphon pyriformis]|nr:hypothetical protein G9A89_005377 [Geosiphon pyriformis]
MYLWISDVGISYAENILTNDAFPNFLLNKSSSQQNISTRIKYETRIMDNSLLLNISNTVEKAINHQKREIQDSSKPNKILIPNRDPKKDLIIDAEMTTKFASCQNPTYSKIKVLTNQFYVNIYSTKEKKYTKIQFRGKELDLSVLKKQRTMTSYRNVKDAMVDTEFYTEFQKGWSKLEKLFLKTRTLASSKFQYFLFGHGIGGVYAILAVLNFLDINSEDGYKSKFTVFTFGQPRIGNEQFANYVHQKLKGRIYRVTNYNDWVPKFPNPTPENPYLHHTREYWLGPIDCDCKSPSKKTSLNTPLYKCPVPINKISGMRMESPFCNAAVDSSDLESAHQAHLGPYFSYTMADCPPMESYLNVKINN